MFDNSTFDSSGKGPMLLCYFLELQQKSHIVVMT